MTHFQKFLAATLALVFSLFAIQSHAQIVEPDIRETPRNISTLTENYSSGIGFNVAMNNFGFGIGGEYRRVVSRQTELSFSLRVTGIRDASEQTFTDIFFGQQIVPNKYQRAFASPLLIGLRHRLFPNLIQDDYRFFASAAIGPSLALTIPYFDDRDNLGYRFTGNELVMIDGDLFRIQPTPVNDIFSGWSSGEFHWGGAGEFKIGVDIGGEFARLSSIEFGYYFYYYPDGLQIMVPNQPEFRTDLVRNNVMRTDEQGNIIFDSFFDPKKFFGTPQITFTFGRLW